jgi:hypothetical protein
MPMTWARTSWTDHAGVAGTVIDGGALDRVFQTIGSDVEVSSGAPEGAEAPHVATPDSGSLQVNAVVAGTPSS